ncbi:MAG: hypothetical protein KTR26_22005 [Flammeovirgaceae bacterium]|nr:hypothetical protein [Flammeovirgaceae bacterium]
MFIIAILSGVLLFFANERQQEKILNSYCSEFGFGAKSITLFKDGTFRFSYYGCSQSGGYLDGNWVLRANFLEVYPNIKDDFLDSKYKKVDNKLVPVNIEGEDFILCEDFKTQFY